MGYLTEKVRRRVAGLILIAAIALAVLAVTDSAFFEDPPTEEERAGDAVQEFYGAAITGDFKRYCELFTESAKDFLRVSVIRTIGSDEDVPSCPEIVALAAERFEGLEVRVQSVSVSGNRARVEVSLKSPGAPGSIRQLLLELDAQDRWLIDDEG